MFALGSLLYYLTTGRDHAAFDLRTANRVFRSIIATSREQDLAKRLQSVEIFRSELAALLTEISESSDIVDPIAFAQRLTAAHQTTVAERARLVQLYLNSPKDFDLFRGTLGHWSDDLTMQLADEHLDDLIHIVARLVDHLPWHFNYQYLDTIANWLLRVWNANDDLRLREEVVARMLEIGERWDENELWNVLREVIKSAGDPADARAIRKVMVTHPKQAKWAVDRQVVDPGPELRKVLTDLETSMAEDF